MFRFEIDTVSELKRAWISKKGHPKEIFILVNFPDPPSIGCQRREFEIQDVSLEEFMEFIREMNVVQSLLEYLESET